MTSIPFLYQDFHGGLNTKDAPYLLTDDEARDVSNVQGTTAGAIVKRAGLATFATPGATLTSLFPFEVGTSSLIGAGGTIIQSISVVGAVSTIATGLTSNLRWEFISGPAVSGQGPLYGMNGTDTPKQWTGSGSMGTWSATDSGGVVPNGKICIYFNNQVYVGGTAAHPSRLFWSAPGDPTAWNPANINGSGFVDLDPNDGQTITGIGKVGPYVMVCKARKLFILVSTNAGLVAPTLRRLADNIGCVSHRTLASGPEGTYFLAEDRGVYVTNGSKITPISDPIQPTVDAISLGGRAQAAGVYFDAHYYLSVPLNSGTNDTVLDFDATLDSWWKHTFGANQFAIFHPASMASLYSAKATSAVVDHCFAPGVLVDNGTAFKWRWAGPWQSPTFYRRRRFPTPYYRKRLRQLRFDGTGTIDFSLAKDFTLGEVLIRSNALVTGGGTFGVDGFYGAPDGSLFGGNPGATGAGGFFGGVGVFGAADGSVYGDVPGLNRTRVYSLGVANAFSIIFSATSTTADMLTSYTMMMTDRKDLVVT